MYQRFIQNLLRVIRDLEIIKASQGSIKVLNQENGDPLILRRTLGLQFSEENRETIRGIFLAHSKNSGNDGSFYYYINHL